MKLEGEYLFEAPVDAVWAALFDPVVLAAVMPGCEKLEVVNGQFVGEMNIKIGPVQGVFSGAVDLKDVQQPTSYTMVIDGRGGPGFLKATVGVRLEPQGSGTKMTYSGEANVGGKIASIGQRLVDASAKAVAKQSLEGLNANIKLRTAAAGVPAPSPAAPTDAAASSPSSAPPPAEPAVSAPATSSAAPPPALPVIRTDPNAFASAVAREVSDALIPEPVRYLLVGLLGALVGGLFVYFRMRG